MGAVTATEGATFAARPFHKGDRKVGVIYKRRMSMKSLKQKYAHKQPHLQPHILYQYFS